ncbi:DUF2753 family protein [Vibrio mediterranei]|uniref:DUF2753 family protein n=1 Tax=Vibrio mediterranei TaxID=689 RepID=A0A3G4VFG0_9VIBR|nr:MULTISPECIES: DUF2753 family protein [Vibrio]AYV23513.1 DUF2753 family protein [Vibrio mediterranei]MCF4172277.1 DUF2753 domain-containing protein [Vibrio sp. McD22-P3]MDA0108600.1 DUF2753 family protein [Vibrio sp. La 4.2.2]NUW75654.1 DUF2753 family protein [Vibrio mediterranei]
MDMKKWERHTLLADEAEKQGELMAAVAHYQIALSESQQMKFDTSDLEELEDLLAVKVMSCHNLADFWRAQGDSEYELKYLQLASEEVMTLLPQCPRTSCDRFISSLGCCKSALVEFLKRHPNPKVANHIANMQTTNDCELIVKFKIH